VTDCIAAQSRFGLSTSPASAEPLRAWKAIVSGTCAQIQVHARAPLPAPPPLGMARHRLSAVGAAPMGPLLCPRGAEAGRVGLQGVL
jgi:hypothetical protein